MIEHHTQQPDPAPGAVAVRISEGEWLVGPPEEVRAFLLATGLTNTNGGEAR